MRRGGRSLLPSARKIRSGRLKKGTKRNLLKKPPYSPRPKKENPHPAGKENEPRLFLLKQGRKGKKERGKAIILPTPFPLMGEKKKDSLRGRQSTIPFNRTPFKTRKKFGESPARSLT